MKLQTECRRLILTVCCTIATITANAGYVNTNPMEYQLIRENEGEINAKKKKQMKKEAEIAALQGSMATEFTIMKGWEAKYNAYLKTAKYAEALKAGTSLYADGVETLRNLYDLQRMAAQNPAGIAASLAMNNLYVETAIELTKTYRTLKNAVAASGKQHMMNAAARTQMLWQLDERMTALNRKLRNLTISIAYYNLTDVWNRATAGLVTKSHESIARDALKRWKRASEVNRRLNT